MTKIMGQMTMTLEEKQRLASKLTKLFAGKKKVVSLTVSTIRAVRAPAKCPSTIN
jgi:hypothetical protein